MRGRARGAGAGAPGRWASPALLARKREGIETHARRARLAREQAALPGRMQRACCQLQGRNARLLLLPGRRRRARAHRAQAGADAGDGPLEAVPSARPLRPWSRRQARGGRRVRRLLRVQRQRARHPTAHRPASEPHDGDCAPVVQEPRPGLHAQRGHHPLRPTGRHFTGDSFPPHGRDPLSHTPTRAPHRPRCAGYPPATLLPSTLHPAERLATPTGRRRVLGHSDRPPTPPVLLADPPACAPVGWPRRRSPCTCSRRAAPTSA